MITLIEGTIFSESRGYNTVFFVNGESVQITATLLSISGDIHYYYGENIIARGPDMEKWERSFVAAGPKPQIVVEGNTLKIVAKKSAVCTSCLIVEMCTSAKRT